MAGTDGRDSEAGSHRRVEGRPETGLCSHKSFGGREEMTTKVQNWQEQQEEGPVSKLWYLSGISKQNHVLHHFSAPDLCKEYNYSLAAHVMDSCIMCMKAFLNNLH